MNGSTPIDWYISGPGVSGPLPIMAFEPDALKKLDFAAPESAKTDSRGKIPPITPPVKGRIAKFLRTSLRFI
jgi:hypothetical protein